MAEKIGFWMYKVYDGDVLQERIIERIKARGIEVERVDLEKAVIKEGKVLVSGRRVDNLSLFFFYELFDFKQGLIMPYQYMVLQALARSMPVINPIDALLLTENKLLTNLIFQQAGLRVPPAILISQQTDELINALESWGPLVLKPIFTYGGHGSIRVETKEQLLNILERLSGFEDRFYAEKFIPNEHWDCRIDLVDGQIVSYYGRRARPGSWRSNIGSGGETFKIEPSKEMKEMACQAFQASGLVLGGVDIIESKSRELYLLEINGVSRMGDLRDEREGICDNEPKIEAIANYIKKALSR